MTAVAVAHAETNTARLLSVRLAAKYLGCSRQQVYGKVAAGELRPVAGIGRGIKLDILDLDRLVELSKKAGCSV